MRFLINNRIIFDEDNSTLALAEENLEPVTLTTIANRLLALLVKNNGILISRDFIFPPSGTIMAKRPRTVT
ncbi:TPA: hypothetical protein ACXNHM_002830 [Serratia marcescens]